MILRTSIKCYFKRQPKAPRPLCASVVTFVRSTSDSQVKLGRGCGVPPSQSYRSISSSSGVASPAKDMGVLSIMGLGDGRGVILCAFFRPSASFSLSHCSATLPQSTAAELVPDFGCCCGVRPLEDVEEDGVPEACPW